MSLKWLGVWSEVRTGTVHDRRSSGLSSSAETLWILLAMAAAAPPNCVSRNSGRSG